MLREQTSTEVWLENIYNLFALEADKEQIYTCSDLNWNEYESVLTTLGNNYSYKVSYLDGVLKLVSPSKNYETAKAKIRTLLEAYCDYAEIDYFAMARTTLKQKDKSSGKEPDESYCFNTPKNIPDLAIEIIETSGGLDDLEKYKRLSIKEVWFWKKNKLEQIRDAHIRFKSLIKSVVAERDNCGILLLIEQGTIACQTKILDFLVDIRPV